VNQIPGRGLRPARPARRGQQFSTHLGLLANTTARVQAPLDAIIVPASRPAVNLDHAITLARKLRCRLVVLCSLSARAREVNELLALRNFNRAIVVDLPDGYVPPKLDLTTSTRVSLDLPDNCVNPNGDLSVKRNIGLLLARMLGWQRIFFLDDDIRDLYSSDLREVAMMLGPCDVVGMRATDFPDNSVVCHGNRKTGGDQDIFVSGSVLAVHCTDAVPFFPEIYNEDWFFFYHAAAARRLGRYGRDATQLCYDPFADPRRAAGQEFGDIMAEGLYGLLHQRAGLTSATDDYWRSFLDTRMSFLAGVLARTSLVDPYLGQRIADSVDAAMAWCQVIEPAMCEHYIGLWQQDLSVWEQRLRAVPTGLSTRAALGQLDLAPAASSPAQLAGIIGGAGRTVPAPTGKAVLVPAVGEVPGRGVIGRMSRRAGEMALRALLAKEPADRADAGRHRKPQEPQFAGPDNGEHLRPHSSGSHFLPDVQVGDSTAPMKPCVAS
jgi:glycosyltransferase involved in cell wall biosynthesis